MRRAVVAALCLAPALAPAGEGAPPAPAPPPASECEAQAAALKAKVVTLEAELAKLRAAAAPIAAPGAGGGDGYRGTSWGMTKAQTRKAVPGTKEVDGVPYLETKIAGLSCLVMFFFVENKLVRSAVRSVERHANVETYLGDFRRLQELLEEKYGKADRGAGPRWDDETFKNDPDHWGLAVASGQAEWLAHWHTDTTAITLRLTGDNYQVSLSVTYQSIKLSSLEVEARERKALEEL